MACLATIGLLAVAVGCGGGSSEGSGAEFSGEVVRVVDGDTIIVQLGDRSERVRYIGIDTPETVAPNRPAGCFGPQASHANKQLVGGRNVRLVLDAEPRDRYGRLLAYVYLPSEGERFVNAELVRRGFADTLRFPPNTSHAAEFAKLRNQARSDDLGLWKDCR